MSETDLTVETSDKISVNAVTADPFFEFLDGAVKPNGFLPAISAVNLNENSSLAELVTGQRATIPALFVGEFLSREIDYIAINIPHLGSVLLKAQAHEGTALFENVSAAWADWVSAASGLKMLFPEQVTLALNFLEDSHRRVDFTAVELICHADDRLGPCFSNLRAIGLLKSSSMSSDQRLYSWMSSTKSDLNTLSSLEQERGDALEQVEHLSSELDKAMNDIKEGSDERELLKLQLLQVQEELELTFSSLQMAEAVSEELKTSGEAELEKHRAEVEELFIKNEVRAQDFAEKISNFTAENELQKLQLSQVQEELEHYFAKCSQQERELRKFEGQEAIQADLERAPNLSMTRTLISRMFGAGQERAL
jgi:hypothetical protein